MSLGGIAIIIAVKFQIILFAAVFSLSIFSCNTPQADTSTDRPNIILCMADDQGWGDTAYNGDPNLRTPNLDSMAAAGLRFDRFYAAAPVCSPTRAGVLTGRHPNRFGCFKHGHPIRPQEITIAEVLKTAGYATGHFGKWHIGSVRNGSPVNPGNSGFDNWVSAPNFYDFNPILSKEGRAVKFNGESSIITADLAINFIRNQVKLKKLFFVVVWFSSPHLPHQAADEDRRLYADQAEKADFYGEITGLDRALGKIRNELVALDIHKNTLLWYCSDNGGLMKSSSGGRGKKGSIYEGGLRVPAILEWPMMINTNTSTAIPATTTDIYPTILEIVGTKPANQPVLDGISLLPVINGNLRKRPKPIGFWNYPTRGKSVSSDALMSALLESQKNGSEPKDKSVLYLNAGSHDRKHRKNRYPDHAAWLDWPWKLHRIQNNKNGRAINELYNLKDDPDEKTDLANQYAERVEVMAGQLENWQKSVMRSLKFKDYK